MAVKSFKTLDPGENGGGTKFLIMKKMIGVLLIQGA
jgi:hypothetical protein